MIVYHIAVTAADDYLARRAAHRRVHLERLQGLRMAGIFVGGGRLPMARRPISSTVCSSPGR